MTIMKNMTPMGNHGSSYGQDVEPIGTYVLEKDFEGDIKNNRDENWVVGVANIKSPLIIELLGDDEITYKYDLAKKYNAKGGKLTKLLMDKGFDSIITKYKGKNYTGEIVLFPNCNFNLNESINMYKLFQKII